MLRMLEYMLGYSRVTLTERERMLVLRNGRFEAILGPGEHRIRRSGLMTETHQLSTPQCTSDYLTALWRERPDLAEAHLTEVVTDKDEVALVARDGRLHEVITQDQRVSYWTDAATWSVERVSLADTHEVPSALAQRLMRSGLTRQLTSVEVAEGKVGLLTVDGAYQRMLQPGTYWFWMLGRKHIARQ
ncbi:MAG: slipin family protein, partial [Pseudomonadota bacterium]